MLLDEMMCSDVGDLEDEWLGRLRCASKGRWELLWIHYSCNENKEGKAKGLSSNIWEAAKTAISLVGATCSCLAAAPGHPSFIYPSFSHPSMASSSAAGDVQAPYKFNYEKGKTACPSVTAPFPTAPSLFPWICLCVGMDPGNLGFGSCNWGLNH